jgi:hypothetical protein
VFFQDVRKIFEINFALWALGLYDESPDDTGAAVHGYWLWALLMMNSVLKTMPPLIWNSECYFVRMFYTLALFIYSHYTEWNITFPYAILDYICHGMKG